MKIMFDIDDTLIVPRVATGLDTDSIEYMHAVWQKGYNPLFTKLRII